MASVSRTAVEPFSTRKAFLSRCTTPQVGSKLLGLVCIGDYGLIKDLSTPLAAIMTKDVQTAAEGEERSRHGAGRRHTGGGERPESCTAGSPRLPADPGRSQS